MSIVNKKTRKVNKKNKLALTLRKLKKIEGEKQMLDHFSLIHRQLNSLHAQHKMAEDLTQELLAALRENHFFQPLKRLHAEKTSRPSLR